MKTLVSIILLTLCLATYGQKIFPYDAKLQDINGNSINSNSFQNDGKPLIVDFWGSFCKPCIVKYNAMMEIYEEWQEETGVKVVIISIDHERLQGASKKIMDKYDWPFEAYFDPNQELMSQLGAGGSVPRTYVFDGDFNLVFENTGASIIPKDSNNSRSVMEIMYERGSLESLTCDLTKYKKAVAKITK